MLVPPGLVLATFKSCLPFIPAAGVWSQGGASTEGPSLRPLAEGLMTPVVAHNRPLQERPALLTRGGRGKVGLVCLTSSALRETEGHLTSTRVGSCICDEANPTGAPLLCAAALSPRGLTVDCDITRGKMSMRLDQRTTSATTAMDTMRLY